MVVELTLAIHSPAHFQEMEYYEQFWVHHPC